MRKTVEREEVERMKIRFEKMMSEGVNGFWRERRLMKRDETDEWIIMKNEEGKRIFDPEENKETIATHYEKLYARAPVPPHPYHDVVKKQITEYSQENTEEKKIDTIPTKEEIAQAIRNKKNNKATAGWKNEILKKGGLPMVEMILPVMEAFWTEEKPPRQWNDGIITNVWKGKGDMEKMMNQRGITVSNPVGTIAEEIATDRLTKSIQISQAQAGGKKGGCTVDHIFILKGLMSLAIKRGMELIITFYDIRKAYDRADMDDMLSIIHEGEFKGKIWRLTQNLNKDLTARVKTKAGTTREIKREKGGKQGGKLMVPLFAKMMDCLPVGMHQIHSLGVEIETLRIAGLVYVDDATTFAKGYQQQEQTLQHVNEFAIKHQLEWGEDKCKVMEVGSHREMKTEWKLGDKTITNCKNYKYLGETISRDGKNIDNLSERFNKVDLIESF